MLQSGANTNDRVRIAEVRRYTSDDYAGPLQQMADDLGTALLPDAPDDTAPRRQVYIDLYADQCVGGFVAVRLEWDS